MTQQARQVQSRYYTIEEEIEQYRQQGCNILTPTSRIETNEFYKPIISLVTLSIDQGDAYERKDSRQNVKYALSLQGLNRIGIAGGIRWDPAETRRVDDGTDKLYIAFQAAGAILGPDGHMITCSQQYDLDLEILREDLEEQHQERCKKWNKPKQEKENYVKYATDRDWRQKRRYRRTLTESGAKARVIRFLYGIKNLFTKQELDKPFVIVRYIAQFPPATPQPVRRRIESEANSNIAQIYGPPPATSPAASGHTETPTDPDPEPDPGMEPDLEPDPIDPDNSWSGSDSPATIEPLDPGQWEDATQNERIAEIRKVAAHVGYDLKAFENRAGATLKELQPKKLTQLYQNLCSMIQ